MRPLQITLSINAAWDGFDLKALTTDLSKHAAVQEPVFVHVTTPRFDQVGFFVGYPLGDELPELERWRGRIFVRRFVQLSDAAMFLAQGWPVMCQGWPGGLHEHVDIPNLRNIPNLGRVLTAPKHPDEKRRGGMRSGAGGAGGGAGGGGSVDSPFMFP